MTIARFTTVVLPLDGHDTSARAIPVARSLAELGGIDIELVEVQPAGYDPQGSLARLEDVAREIDGDRRTTTVVAQTFDSVGRALSDLALDPGAVLCMAAHGRGAREALLGSVSRRVIHHSPVPVLLVGPACTTTGPADLTRPALVAVQGAESDGALIATAAAWGRATGADLRLVHLVTSPGDAEVWDTADALLEEAASQLRASGVTVTTETHAGVDVGDDLLAIGDGAGCIITGSHRRGALARLVLGSTVSTLVHGAGCPVLVAWPAVDSTSRGAARGSGGDDGGRV